MESAIGNNAAVDDLPPTERGACRQATQSEAIAACHELCGFLEGGLAAAQKAVGQTLALQLAMMDVVSRQVLNLRGNEQSGIDSESMLELVTAIQSDDLLRQRHENLARALAIMSQAVREARDLVETAVESQPSAIELRRRWIADLLETLTLDEMRQGFEQDLEAAGGNLSPHPAGPSRDGQAQPPR